MQCLAASPTGEVELGSAEQGIPEPQRVKAPRGEPSAAPARTVSPSRTSPHPFPPPLLAATAVAMRCCETPVNKPCLEWSESPRAVCLVVRGSKVGIVPRLAITALPLPGPVSGSDAGAGPPRRALPGEEGAQLLRTPGPARAPAAPQSRGPGKGTKWAPALAERAARSDARTAPREQARSTGRGASGQSSLGRFGKVGAGTHGLIFDRMTSGCGRPWSVAGRGSPDPAVAWHLLLDGAARGRARSGKSASDPTRGPSSDPAGGASSSTSPTPAASKLGPARFPH